MDLQVSLARILLNDNSPTSPTYSDAELRAACTLGGPAPALPNHVLTVGTVVSTQYPVVEP